MAGVVEAACLRQHVQPARGGYFMAILGEARFRDAVQPEDRPGGVASLATGNHVRRTVQANDEASFVASVTAAARLRGSL